MTSSMWSMGDNRIAAVYSSREKVIKAKESLLNKFKVNDAAVKVIAPNADSVRRKLEKDSQTVGKNMLIWHLMYGAIGLAVGLAIGWLLVNYGPDFTRLNPMFTYIAMLSPGLFIGLFFSGLLSLKPHHDAINQSALSAANQDEWTMIIKLEGENLEKDEILPFIEQSGASRIV